MYEISYLSSQTRDLINKLEEKKKSLTDVDELQMINTKIEELKTETKNYLKCDIDEAFDLKYQLFDKLTKLSQIGKIEGVQQFQMLIQWVETHIQRLALEQIARDKQEKKIDPEEVDVRRTKLERITPKEGSDKPPAKSHRHRWAIRTNIKLSDSSR